MMELFAEKSSTLSASYSGPSGELKFGKQIHVPAS